MVIHSCARFISRKTLGKKCYILFTKMLQEKKAFLHPKNTALWKTSGLHLAFLRTSFTAQQITKVMCKNERLVSASLFHTQVRTYLFVQQLLYRTFCTVQFRFKKGHKKSFLANPFLFSHYCPVFILEIKWKAKIMFHSLQKYNK